jgi:hypothetical protein
LISPLTVDYKGAQQGLSFQAWQRLFIVAFALSTDEKREIEVWI